MKGAAPAIAAAVLIAALYVAAAWRVAGEPGFPLDDAWIHARLAQNAAHGEGLVFNPGQRAAVSSAPLWSLLLAVPAALRVPFPWASFAAGLVAAAALAVAAWSVGWSTGGGRGAALACALCVVGTHPFPWLSVSGMEAGLAAALVLFVLLTTLRGRPGAALALCAAAAAVRPELALLPLLVVADYFVRKRPVRRWAALPAAAIAAACVPFVAARIFSGVWIPGAFAAKVGRHGVVAALLAGRPGEAPAVLLENPPLYFGPLALALLRDNAILAALAPLGIRRMLRGASGTHLPWMIVLLLPAAMAVLAPFGGPDFHEQRYVAPIVAVMFVCGALGAAEIVRLIPARAGRFASIVAVIALSAWGVARGGDRYAREVADIEGMQVQVARWIAARPDGAGRIATHDIGAIGFFTRAPILDLTGLASPEVFDYLRRPPPPGRVNRGWNGASESGLLDLLRKTGPAYVALFPSWYPELTSGADLGPPVLRVTIDDNLICGDSTMLVFRPRPEP